LLDRDQIRLAQLELEHIMSTSTDHVAAATSRPRITFTVDGEPVHTDDPTLTPNQILQLAGVEPATHYLVRVQGRHQESFQGHGDQPIHVHEHEVFLSVSTGPTPVS
jgi:hypothetical protein